MLNLLLFLSAGWNSSLPEVAEADAVPVGRVVSIETKRPLVFRLRAGTELLTIRVDASTRVMPAGDDKIRPGVAVRVEGRRNDNTVSASEIELLKTTIGQITAVQEVSPLRLVLKTGEDSETVELKTSTLVRDRGRKIEAGRLQNKQWIVAYGSQTTRRLKADVIDVLTERTGEISAIREVFPTQIVVKTGPSTTEVRLDTGTQIMRGAATEKLESLRVGSSVRVLGIETGGRLSAFRIELR